MKQMTEYQRTLAAEYLYLVKEVIQKRIKVSGRPLLTFDDFFGIGCEALCRAAIVYQPELGAFEPLACRYIYNALIDHCRKQNYHQSFMAGETTQEDGLKMQEHLGITTTDYEDEAQMHIALDQLSHYKEQYTGVARKGIEAIELKLLGYSTREIAARNQTTVNNVNAWIARARSKLKKNEDFLRKLR